MAYGSGTLLDRGAKCVTLLFAHEAAPVSLTALVLLVVAAALHTGWNLLVKRAGEKQIFTWWAMVVGTACFAPLLAFSAPLPAAIWPYVLTSALVETIYYLALLRAYTIGDFSLVYPLARGAAPAFLALWAALFLGERPHAGGIAGLALLLIGLLLVGGAARRAALRHAAEASTPVLQQRAMAQPAQGETMFISSELDADKRRQTRTKAGYLHSSGSSASYEPHSKSRAGVWRLPAAEPPPRSWSRAASRSTR